jgi:Lar family restriction alleviation protein
MEIAPMTVGETEVLKPCPFCGSSDIAVHVGLHGFVDALVRCESCSVEGPVFGVDEVPKRGDKEEKERLGAANRGAAVSHWNTRSSAL